MIQTISDKLLEKFQTLTWTNKPLVSVKDYHTLENDWFPYLTFECTWFNAQILDNCNNLRIFQFDVYIFQDIDNDSWRKTSKENLNKIMDDVIALIDKDYTLWITDIKQVQPISATINSFEIWTWKALVWNITLNVETYYFIK